MRRYELAFTDQDKDHEPIDAGKLSAVLSEISGKCGGYARSRRFGFWISPEGVEYASPETLVTADAPVDPQTLDWFKEKKTAWQMALNYKQLYIAGYTVDWL